VRTDFTINISFCFQKKNSRTWWTFNALSIKKHPTGFYFQLLTWAAEGSIGTGLLYFYTPLGKERFNSRFITARTWEIMIFGKSFQGKEKKIESIEIYR